MKRIIICADGTWNSPLNDNPSNILALARGIRPVASGQSKQVVFYDWGVGSDRKKLSGGISGVGIDKNIKDCYRFIVHNYKPRDELFLMGFSRGAYTVRSLAGFIRNCGVIKRQHADQIEVGYDLYRKRPKSTGPNSAQAVSFRSSFAVADITEIRFVGVFDTVGALGVPITFWGLLDNAEYLFHDTAPSRIIKTARHAVSIDENREDFIPTMWDPKPELNLKQVWFSGFHSDIGGGYKDRGLSDTAFAWMLKEAKRAGLVVEPHLTSSIHPDPLGKQHNERKKIYRFRKKVVREIPADAVIHRSVRTRLRSPVVTASSAAMKRFLAKHDGRWPLVNTTA